MGNHNGWTKGIVLNKIGNSLFNVFIPTKNIVLKRHKNQLYLDKLGENSDFSLMPLPTKVTADKDIIIDSQDKIQSAGEDYDSTRSGTPVAAEVLPQRNPHRGFSTTMKLRDIPRVTYKF